MAIDFPASPTVGQTVTVGGVTWTWDGVKWVAQGTGVGVYLPLTGGTMTGDLVLNRDAQVALGAATKQQVDARGAGDNRIINGDMRLDQRGVASGAGGTAFGVYTIDRWIYGATQTSKGTWQRGTAGAPLVALGFGNSLVFTSSSAFTSAATDSFNFYQPIEADMVSDFAWGTAGAQPVTLSFWAFSTLTGTFSGALFNYPLPATRSYPFSFSLPNASTWTKIVITIPGDTAGTWVMSGNAAAFGLAFDLGSGTNFRGPAGAWANANYRGATGAVSVVATNAAQFVLAGVKLEIGSVATPYSRQSLAKSLADCQRYFYRPLTTLFSSAYHPTAAGLSIFATRSFPVTMRAAPTQSGATFSNVNMNTVSVTAMNVDGAIWTGTNAAAGSCQIGITGGTETYSAEL